MKYLLLLPLSLMLFFSIATETVYAQGILSNSSLYKCIRGYNANADTGDTDYLDKGLGDIAPGSCDADQIIDLVDSIVQWGAGVAGAIALLMYILGGVWLLFSGGSSSRVERGKSIITGTTIALIFILGSWLMVDFTLRALTRHESYLEAKVCGDQGTCPIGTYCENNDSCSDRCDEELGDAWVCTENFCNKGSREGCRNDPNCVLDMCGGGNDKVCCKTGSSIP